MTSKTSRSRILVRPALRAAVLGYMLTGKPSHTDFYFCIDDPVAALENVEIAPDGMSDAGTAFTRYTANPTTMASSTRRSSCVFVPCVLLRSVLTSFRLFRKTATSRRKAALKRVAGRKGTVYEEMYLLNSVKKAVETRLAELQGTCDAAPRLTCSKLIEMSVPLRRSRGPPPGPPHARLDGTPASSL